MFRGNRGLAKDSSNQLFGLIQSADIDSRCMDSTPRPPSAAGREAFSQEPLEKGPPPAKSERASSIELSNADVASLTRCGEQKRRAKETLGKAKQNRRMVVSI